MTLKVTFELKDGNTVTATASKSVKNFGIDKLTLVIDQIEGGRLQHLLTLMALVGDGKAVLNPVDIDL